MCGVMSRVVCFFLYVCRELSTHIFFVFFVFLCLCFDISVLLMSQSVSVYVFVCLVVSLVTPTPSARLPSSFMRENLSFQGTFRPVLNLSLRTKLGVILSFMHNEVLIYFHWRKIPEFQSALTRIRVKITNTFTWHWC